MQYHGISATRAARVQARVLRAFSSSLACTTACGGAAEATTRDAAVANASEEVDAGENAAPTGAVTPRGRARFVLVNGMRCGRGTARIATCVLRWLTDTAPPDVFLGHVRSRRATDLQRWRVSLT